MVGIVLVQLVSIPANRYAFPIYVTVHHRGRLLGYRVCDRIFNRQMSLVVKEKFR